MINAVFKSSAIALSLATSLVASALSIGAAEAASPEEIKAKGVAVIGVQMDQFPWGFIDENGKNGGFDIDVANLIAEELGVEVKFERVTGQNRIPLLTNGMVDFLVPSMTITPERAKVIQFVLPYSANDITVWGRRTPKSTATRISPNTRSASIAAALSSRSSRRQPAGTKIKGFDDDAATVQALLSGQVDAILGSLTYGLVIESTGNGDKYVRKYKAADNIQAMAVRKGDQAMLDFLNDFVTRHNADGSLDTLYKKWIGVDRPKLPTTLEGVDFIGKQ
ncbi:transporter substrate-binding domain-containing protein [Ochrobactrum ciceri]|uniref:Transporter substrate-binding domain-containing protein n=1 Tax=Brucella ciceri TaxID=391287 RepID=A0ABX1DVA5_9HYPH|nr:transporter substrate-binding domain-containing protein [Brucella ciceri]